MHGSNANQISARAARQASALDAFQQHILASLTANGRCAALWPHGVLFRNEEQAMRAKMVDDMIAESFTEKQQENTEAFA